MRTLLSSLILLVLTAHAAPGITIERPLDDGPSFGAYLISYQSSGLKVHAMVAVPDSEVPENGFPVVIANHGYVPDPRKYGITAEGIDSRPGDYYRSVPELYASRGFMVILPDYRGHNSSEGFAQIENQDRQSLHTHIDLYASDVIELLSHLDEVEDADLDRVFMWSHSMGGGVSIRALLATDVVKASSFWASMSVDDMSEQLVDIGGPVIIHHARRDQSTEHANSTRFAAALEELGHAVEMHSLDSADHYFDGEMREKAADRDVAYFLSH
ncbi:MAG: dienelactone hydrolase family protein [Woeseiaceae bacterium]